MSVSDVDLGGSLEMDNNNLDMSIDNVVDSAIRYGTNIKNC